MPLSFTLPFEARRKNFLNQRESFANGRSIVPEEPGSLMASLTRPLIARLDWLPIHY